MDPWKVDEAGTVGRHDQPAMSASGRRDDQVVGSSLAAGLPCGNQQITVDVRNIHVVGQDGHLRDEVVEECSASLSRLALRERQSDSDLSDGDSCDRELVVIIDQTCETRR